MSIEVPFRLLPEYELRTADVAVVSVVRLNQADPEDNLPGAPELVIEVLSPSNTAAEIIEKQGLCLENGCLEFGQWSRNPVWSTCQRPTALRVGIKRTIKFR